MRRCVMKSYHMIWHEIKSGTIKFTTFKLQLQLQLQIENYLYKLLHTNLLIRCVISYKLMIHKHIRCLNGSDQ